ncbi:hypothetical protein H2248_001613 [Termitomyces sp. 'cryptogamus']|nr:hypothetical protein H2248_001613 [Termitomyces sp. 'cryptogamus']
MRSAAGTNSTPEKDGASKTRRKPGRVPTACAECRRLKLKCDKGVPCEKCVSRGCGSICPDGTLAPGKGNRLILANTEELHDRIETLCSRIRDLESALRTANHPVSDQPHPLLQKDVLQPIFPHPPVAPTSTATNILSSAMPPEQPPDPQSQPTGADQENFVDAFGTLVLGAGDQCTYYGRTARSEFLIGALGEQQPRTFSATSRLSKQIIDASSSESTSCDFSFIREALNLLPPLSKAVPLCEIYEEYGKFMYTPVPRTELFDEILTTIYRVDSHEAFTNFDLLALLFGVFALGAYFDPNRQPYSVESQEFYHISRAVLRLSSQATQASIQARIHVVQYLEFSDWESVGSHETWMYIGHAVRLAQSAGLHLNSVRWNLSETHIQCRSRLFWQLFHLDTWTSFHLGRQPAMSPFHIDWSLHPEANLANHDYESFDAWNWRYSALLHYIMVNAFGPKQPSYIAVLSMDRQIRDFPVHPTWRPVCDRSPPTELSIQRWTILSTKEETLLNLHRAYFASAIEEMPNQLMRHRYLPSVMSVYRSAWRLMRGLKMVWGQAPHVISRTTLAWSQALSATVVMCLLITRAPTSSLARSAMTELTDVLDFFKTVTSMAPPAANLLGSIQRLHRKAHDAFNRSGEGIEDALSNTELDRWAGKTHVLSRVGSDFGPSQSPSQPATPHTAAEGDYWSDAQVDTLHPTLAEVMRNFDARSSSFDWFFDFPMTGTRSLVLQPPEVQVNDPHFYTPIEYHTFQPQTHQSPFLQTTPTLDATWQTLAEQLGF